MWPRALRVVLVVAALGCGIGAGWLLDRAGRLPMPSRADSEATNVRELAQRRIADAPVWLIALGVLLFVGLPVVALSRQLQQIAAVQHAALSYNLAAQSVARRDSVAGRLTSLRDVEDAVAQLIADALGCSVEPRPGCLMADVLPAPYITVTDMRGTRYMLTAHHALFARMRLVPSDAQHGHISRRSRLAHAEVLAVWDAVRRLKSLTHMATPAGGDWRVSVIQPSRARRAFWQRLRADRRMRALSRLPSRAAALSPVLRLVLPERQTPPLRSAQRQLAAGRADGAQDVIDVPARPAGDGGAA